MRRLTSALGRPPMRWQARVSWKRCVGGAGTLALLLLVYFQTLAPTITWAHYGADGGDLVTAVARGSIPHPPGFPTYLLLGELFICLPWGEPAWRLNVMSAVLAASAAALTASAVGLLSISSLPSRDHDWSPALCAGLSLGLSPLFWSQAVITEVYAPAACLAALVMLLALRKAPPWAMGLAWGLGVAAHPSLVFLAPVVAWGAWGGERGRLERLSRVGLLALLGWGAMGGPVLLARRGAPSPWGSVDTLPGWWAFVSGQIYHGYVFGLALTAWPRRLLAWMGLLVRQFTPLGAGLVVLGWLRLWRERRPLAGISAGAFGAFSVYAIGYDTVDSVAYLVPALPLMVLWLGCGLAQAAAWIRRRSRAGVWLILLLPLLQALLFWGQADVSNDRTAVEWAESTLEQAPHQAVLLTARDAHTFTLWYVHEVLGQRPDVLVLDRDLWAQDSYRRIVSEALNLETVANGLSPEDAARHAGRPVVEVTVRE